MTPEERNMVATYERLFERLPLYRQHVHALVGRCEPLDAAQIAELNRQMDEAMDELLGMVFEAAFGLKGRPAGPELSKWLRDNGLLHGPLHEVTTRIREVEEALRTCGDAEAATLERELEQLHKERRAYDAMQESRVDQAVKEIRARRQAMRDSEDP